MVNNKQRVIDMLQIQIDSCKNAIQKLDLSNPDKRTKAWRDKKWYEKSIEIREDEIQQILKMINSKLPNKLN
jgi:hypothetical protein